MYNVTMDKKTKITAMDELDKFCKNFGYYLELEKPFPDMDGFFLKVSDILGEEVHSSIVPDLRKVEAAASEILGVLSKQH